MESKSELDIATFRKGKAEFDEAHRKGMDALRRHDYAELTEAINTERSIVETQQRALQQAQGHRRRRSLGGS